MAQITFNIPTWKVTIHWPGLDQSIILEMFALPSIGMEVMDPDGNLYKIHRVIIHLDYPLAEVYCLRAGRKRG